MVNLKYERLFPGRVYLVMSNCIASASCLILKVE